VSIFLLSCLFLKAFAQHLICFIQDQHFNSLHLSQQSRIDGIQDVDIAMSSKELEDAAVGSCSTPHDSFISLGNFDWIHNFNREIT